MGNSMNWCDFRYLIGIAYGFVLGVSSVTVYLYTRMGLWGSLPWHYELGAAAFIPFLIGLIERNLIGIGVRHEKDRGNGGESS